MLNENGIVIKLLNMPHVLIQSRKNRFWIAVGIFFFIWFFLFAFGVFNFDTYSVGDRFLRTFIYALSCFLTTLFNFFVLQDIFLKKYNFKEIILWSLWLATCVGTTNFLISSFLFHRYEPKLLFWFYNQVYVFSIFVLFFPSILLANYMINIKKQLRKVNEEANKLKYHQSQNNGNGFITIRSKYKSDHFNIDPTQILYICSAGNYVEIHFKNGSSIEQHLLRNTLSAIEKQKPDPSFVRCHRSFIVNINHVDFIKKQSGSDYLILNKGMTKIPLSKNYKKLLTELISKPD